MGGNNLGRAPSQKQGKQGGKSDRQIFLGSPPSGVGGWRLAPAGGGGRKCLTSLFLPGEPWAGSFPLPSFLPQARNRHLAPQTIPRRWNDQSMTREQAWRRHCNRRERKSIMLCAPGRKSLPRWPHPQIIINPHQSEKSNQSDSNLRSDQIDDRSGVGRPWPMAGADGDGS